MRMISRSLLALAVGLLSACAMPQPASQAVADQPSRQIVVTGNATATAVARDILRQGGSAVDAAIAAQAVLGLVEPQSSGLLGGIDILLTTPDGGVQSIDGMATAPSGAMPAPAMDPDGTLLDPRRVAFSPRAVGVPGVLPALYAAYRSHGRLAWARLFEPAIALARNGTPMPRLLHDLLTDPQADDTLGAVRALYADASGAVPVVGQSFRNPAYAAALLRIAQSGPDGLLQGTGLDHLLTPLRRGAYASSMRGSDLRGITPRIGPALCRPWQGYRICTAPPPAAGGFVMLQILAMTQPGRADDADFVHRFLEASRLAQADRRRYLADPGFIDVPVEELLDPDYLAGRSRLISPTGSIEHPQAGSMDEAALHRPDPGQPQAGTSSVAVVDAQGLAVAFTSTVNLHFGARIVAEGMVFNNALINFAPPPPTTLPGNGGRYANEMAPGKRPVSPVAPVIVLDAQNRPVLLGGGAGGPAIPDEMAMALIRVLGEHARPAQALAEGHVNAADPDHIVVEQGSTAEALRPALEALGHRVEPEPVDSGTVLLLRQGESWIGAGDPRREGREALGVP